MGLGPVEVRLNGTDEERTLQKVREVKERESLALQVDPASRPPVDVPGTESIPVAAPLRSFLLANLVGAPKTGGN
jgi:hypothetical protein